MGCIGTLFQLPEYEPPSESGYSGTDAGIAEENAVAAAPFGTGLRGMGLDLESGYDRILAVRSRSGDASDPVSYTHLFYTQEEGMGAYVPEDRELLFFAVRNVMEELFTGEKFETAEDGGFCIYLFLLKEKMPREKWYEDCVQRLLRLDSFFREKMRLKLIISAGEVYEDFDETPLHYKRLELLREYQRPVSYTHL